VFPVIRRLIAPILVSVITASVLVPAQRPVAAAHPAAVPRVHNDVLALRLAHTLNAASTPGAKYKAILAILSALHIGVYNAQTGKPVARGAESSPKDFYLYDYELSEMVRALSRDQDRSLGDIAQILTSLGIKPGGKPVDPDMLRRALIAETRAAAAHPTQSFSLLPLIVRDLGLAHQPGYDLTNDVSLADLQLDPLQTELIMLGILEPTIHSAAHGASAQALSGHVPLGTKFPGACHAIAIAVSPFDPNTWIDLFGGTHQQYVADSLVTTQISDFIQALHAAEREVGAINLAYTIAMSLHAMILAYGIKIESLPELRPTTHYGPRGSGDEADAGQPITFRAEVTMQDDLGKTLIQCLSDAGFSVPAKGPVEGMPVDWYQSAEDLEKYGTIAYQPSDQKTGKDGIASMVFFPHNEKTPGFGTYYSKTGTVEPRALWGMQAENLLGTVSEVITPKLGSEFNWTVSYHKPRGFKFSHLKWSTSGNFGTGYPDGHSTFDVSGHVCGDDPNAIWTTDSVESDNWPVFGTNYSGTYESVYELNGPIRTRWNEGGTTVKTWIVWGKNPTFYARIQAATNPGGTWVSPADQTVSAPLVEDTSCPDNSDG
jgi:hypothetical protein